MHLQYYIMTRKKRSTLDKKIRELERDIKKTVDFISRFDYAETFRDKKGRLYVSLIDTDVVLKSRLSKAKTKRDYLEYLKRLLSKLEEIAEEYIHL